MKLGRLPRGLAVAAVAAVTVVPLAASSAVGRSGRPDCVRRVRQGRASVLGQLLGLSGRQSPRAVRLGEDEQRSPSPSRKPKLAEPDESRQALSGRVDQRPDLQPASTRSPARTRSCREAQVEHAGPDARHAERWPPSWGKDGKFPGQHPRRHRLRRELRPPARPTRSARPTGPAGALAGYVSVGSSSASHDLSIDDKGRLVSRPLASSTTSRSGPKNEVHFSSLVTTAHAPRRRCREHQGRPGRHPDQRLLHPRQPGRADPGRAAPGQRRPVRAGGLRRRQGPAAEAEGRGASPRAAQLRRPGGPKTPTHVAVEAKGLRVTLRAGGRVARGRSATRLELGHATAVVAALDAPGRTMDVNENASGVPTVENTQTAPASPGPTPAAPREHRRNDSGHPTASPPTKPAGTVPKDDRRLPRRRPAPARRRTRRASRPARRSDDSSGRADRRRHRPALANPDEDAFGLRRRYG